MAGLRAVSMSAMLPCISNSRLSGPERFYQGKERRPGQLSNLSLALCCSEATNPAVFLGVQEHAIPAPRGEKILNKKAT